MTNRKQYRVRSKNLRQTLWRIEFSLGGVSWQDVMPDINYLSEEKATAAARAMASIDGALFST
jgi:hypothetical protein